MEGKVSSRQVIYLIAISRVITMLTIMPTIRMGPENQDIWIMILASFFYTIILYSPMLFLSTRFRNISMIKFMEKIFGKILGKTIGSLYSLHFIRIAILFTYITVQTIRSLFLTMTPAIVFILFIILTCTYMAINGIEVICRFAELLGPIVFIEIIILFILGIENIDLRVLLPIYKDSTFLQLNIGAIELSTIFTDVYILTTVVPKLENKEEANKIFFKSVGYSLIIIFLSVIFTQGTLGIEQAKHANFPFLIFIRLIDVKSILQRIEVIFILMWMVCIILRISVYLYMASDSIREILNKKSRRKFIYIVGAFVGAITYYLAEFNPQIEKIIRLKLPEYIFYLIFKTGIPLIGVIVYLFRRKSIEEVSKT